MNHTVEPAFFECTKQERCIALLAAAVLAAEQGDPWLVNRLRNIAVRLANGEGDTSAAAVAVAIDDLLLSAWPASQASTPWWQL